MNRFGSIILALAAAALLVPIAAEAQQDSRYTRDANRYLALALTRQDEAQRRQMYEQAMGPLREGLQREPDNAQLYLLLGQAETGLGNYAEAAAAFRRAVELHPPYEEEVDEQREESWATAAQRGIDHIGEGQYEEALRHFEGADLFSQSRPEAVYYLGNLYLHFQRWDDSHAAYTRAIQIIDNAPADTPEELRESWVELRSTAREHLGLVITQRGAMAFEAEDYVTALESFQESVDVAPHSRDNWLNVVTVQFHLLARNLETSPGYSEGTKKYILGKKKDGSDFERTPGDAYRRHIYSGLIRVANAAGRRDTP
jgi:tetratricopeptide (TPR) repeat protein